MSANLEFKILVDEKPGVAGMGRFRSHVGSDLNVIKGDFGKAGVAIREEMVKVARGNRDMMLQNEQAILRAQNALNNINKITAPNLGTSQVRAATGAYRELGNELSNLSPMLGRFSGLGVAGGVGALATGFIAAAKTGIQYQETLEKLAKSFETLLGSQSAANQLIKDLQALAARTPFEFEDIARGTQRLLNMGVAAKDVVPILTSIGNAVAAAGGGSEQIDRVTLAIAQMSAKGKVSAEEMNQLAEAGVGGWRLLEQQLGKTKGELMKMAEQGQISADTFIKAFRAAHESGRGMADQMGTLTGATSTLTDYTKQLLADGFKPMHATLRDITVELARMTTEGFNASKMAVALGSALRNAFNFANLGSGDQWLIAAAMQAGGPGAAALMSQLLGGGKKAPAQWGAAEGPWGEKDERVAVPDSLKYKPKISDEDLAQAAKGRMERARQEGEQEAARAREKAQKDAEKAREHDKKLLKADEEDKLEIYRRTIKKILEWNKDSQRDLERAREESKKADEEWAERIADASDAVRAALKSEIAILTDENTHLTEINNTIRRAEILGAIDARTAAFLRQLAVVNELVKVMPDAGTLQGMADAVGVVPIPLGAGPVVDPTEFTKEFGEPPPPNFDPWKEAIGSLKEMAVGSFKDMAGALGEMVGQWVLYGSQAQVSARKMVASVLASVAMQAAVQSIYELALGFAALTPWGAAIYGPAPLHFKASALLAGVAVAAGVAGRVAAGSSFAGAGGGGAGAFGDGTSTNEREDNRTKYLREQAEKDKHTRREDRRESFTVTAPIVIDGREVTRAVINVVRDGGSERDAFRNAFAT